MGLCSLLRLLSKVLYWEWRGIPEGQSVGQELGGRYSSCNTSDGPLGATVVPSELVRRDDCAARVLIFIDVYVGEEMHA